jgi:hypothetical protein
MNTNMIINIVPDQNTNGVERGTQRGHPATSVHCWLTHIYYFVT